MWKHLHHVRNIHPAVIANIEKLIWQNFPVSRLNTNHYLFYISMQLPNVVACVGLQKQKRKRSLLLNQLCVARKQRRRGLETYMLSSLKSLQVPLELYINKNERNTHGLFNFIQKTDLLKALTQTTKYIICDGLPHSSCYVTTKS